MADGLTIEEMGTLYTFPNLADEYIDETKLSEVGKECMMGYEIDKQSVSTRFAQIEKNRKLAAQEVEAKTTPWVNASNVKYPLITSSAYQFNARSYSSIINNNNIALVRSIGEDESGEKQERADRVSKHMSFQLTEEMDGWESDMDCLLLALPTDGIAFKKVYRDTVDDRNASDFVSSIDLIVNNSTKSLKYAPRISMEFSLYPYEVMEHINAELFLEWRDEVPDDDKQEPIEFVEQHCRIDLDDDGYAEPYIVTFTKEGGEVVRVVANFRREDINERNDEIIKITPTQYFVKYQCFPDPEGAFYSRGFADLLGPINGSIDTILNQLIDAGTLSNMQSGFLAKGFRVKSGTLSFTPGEWKKVDTSGVALRDSVLPMPVRDPSQVLFLLLGVLMDAGKEVSSIQDVMTGGAGPNTAATTVLALIEQGMTVYTAIFKRIYRSLKEELNLLYDLNRLYLEDGTYQGILDTPQAIAKADYEDESMDIRPAADPSMATDIQKAAKSQILMQFKGDPTMNQAAINKEVLESAGFTNAEEYLVPPNQPPSEQEQLMMQKEAADMEFQDREIRIREREVRIKEEELGIKQQDSEATQFKNYSQGVYNMARANEEPNKTAIAKTKASKEANEQGNDGR